MSSTSGIPHNRILNGTAIKMMQGSRKRPLAQPLLVSVLLASFLLLLIRKLLYKNKQLEVLAMTDSLTGLLNQRAFVAALHQELEQAQRYNRTFAVLFLDLNYFKLINDIYDHSIGDMVLRKFARMVELSLRKNDTLGRWGGDEFVIILHETDEIGAKQVIERIHTTLANHLLIDESDFHLTCSIGSATFPLSAQVCEQLIAAADQAMYEVKCQAHKHKYPSPTKSILEPESSKIPQRVLAVALR